MPKRKTRTDRVAAPKLVSPEGLNAHGEVYGVEGTNKTIPVPQNNAEPSPELQGAKSLYIPKSPYTRG